MATTTSTGVFADTASAAASVGTTEALVMVAWLHLEVPVGNPEQGDRNSHNGSTYCWPGDTPLHDVPSNCKQCTGRELTAEPAMAVAVGGTAEKSDPCSGLW